MFIPLSFQNTATLRMVNKKKQRHGTMSDECKQALQNMKQARRARMEEHMEEPEPPLPASRPSQPTTHVCPVCPGCSSAGPSSAGHSSTVNAHSHAEADNTTPVSKMAAIRSRPILQAGHRFSHHHRKVSLATQRRPQSVGSGLRRGLFTRRCPTLPQQPQPQQIQHKTKQHSASSLKLSAYLRRAKRRYKKTNSYVPLVTRPLGNRIISCIQLEESIKQLGCGSCGMKNLILEERTRRADNRSDNQGWATYIRWKCRGEKCDFSSEWTCTSPRVSPKGAFEVSTFMSVLA